MRGSPALPLFIFPGRYQLPLAETWQFQYLILPFLIFCSRILDVSIGTIRIIFVSRGKKFIAPLLGIFEVLLWLVVITQVMKHLNNWAAFIGYALGFATGNFIGMILEEKLAIGISVIRIISVSGYGPLINALQDSGFGLTIMDGHGPEGPVKIIFTTVRRKDIKSVKDMISRHAEGSFYTIEDARFAKDAVFPPDKPGFFWKRDKELI